MAELLCQVPHNRQTTRSLTDAFREGILEGGAGAAPARGAIHSAPGRVRASCSPALRPVRGVLPLDWDRQPRVTPAETGSQEAWPGPEPLGLASLWREPRWNADKRACPLLTLSRASGEEKETRARRRAGKTVRRLLHSACRRSASLFRF